MNWSTLWILIIIFFVISLIGLFFIKRMKAFVYSYVIFEIGLFLIVLIDFIDISGWGKITYTSIGLVIIVVGIIIAIITFLFKIIKKSILRFQK